ncbi:hypothetical protein QP164_01445 [Sphingomonas sp. LR59]
MGVAADYCVRWAVEGLVDRGFAVRVPAALTRESSARSTRSQRKILPASASRFRPNQPDATRSCARGAGHDLARPINCPAFRMVPSTGIASVCPRNTADKIGAQNCLRGSRRAVSCSTSQYRRPNARSGVTRRVRVIGMS